MESTVTNYYPPVKPTRYYSKFYPSAKQEMKAAKHPMRTIGPAKVEVLQPENFLRKHSKEPKLPRVQRYEKDCNIHRRKPEVPKRTDMPIMGITSNQNYVETNILDNMYAVPKKRQPIYADTRWGDKHLLLDSGLIPKYILKKDYGEVPDYIKEHKEVIRKLVEAYKEYVKEQRRKEAPMSKEERDTVLEGLRKNFEDLYGQYQCLPIIKDTPGKEARKISLEAAMNQMESDINLMDRNETIYVADAPEDADYRETRSREPEKAYLEQLDEETQRREEAYDAYVKKRMEQEGMVQVSKEEREMAIEGLQKKFEELYHEFQCLPIVEDTLGKIKNKQRLHDALNKVEDDLNRLKRNKAIYIARSPVDMDRLLEKPEPSRRREKVAKATPAVTMTYFCFPSSASASSCSSSFTSHLASPPQSLAEVQQLRANKALPSSPTQEATGFLLKDSTGGTGGSSKNSSSCDTDDFVMVPAQPTAGFVD